MLFNYRYVAHDIEKFQTWLDHLVKEVWCRNGGAYSLDLLHADLKAVVEDIANDERITTDYLDGPIKAIDALFQNQLNAAQRAQVSLWYDHNNDIEALCGNDPHKTPGTYADIRAINSDLEKELKSFCKSLFTDVIHLKAVTKQTAEIDSHYDAFVAENDEGKCPYCGYGDIKGHGRTKREAYDHFLPKGTYPFNSVNFKNLAPICTECNSSYKLQKDPIRETATGSRRKAFYSYASAAPDISINLTLSTSDIAKLSKDNITLNINAPGRDEEVESWKDIFGIEERYKDKCCAKNDGKAWLQQIIEECANCGQAKDQLIGQVIRAADRSPFDSANFLKKPFLLACKAANVF
ncbi:MAG TPA: hypothetical protein DCZ95_05320 [Verrucomicrobia bacterium]|nr:MAG: hypothetical protein A2X46_10380 [Lentisphaerae bacterium GWF2_57_35]HBA83498.1 hypothetical protein [Verrucomicrobiota bacterium]